MIKKIKRVLYVASMGLGLGIGVTVSVLGAQTVVKATPVHAQKEHVILAKRLVLSKNRAYSVSNSSNKNGAHFIEITKTGLGSGKMTLLVGRGSSLKNQFKDVVIGTEFSILGDNNGVYVYTVTQILTVPQRESTALITDTQEQVLVAISAYPWESTATIFVGSYRQ